jgi:hypothetical protein
LKIEIENKYINFIDVMDRKLPIITPKRKNQKKKIITHKEKLLLTRSRMLQISQDRNSYKKKIIYSLIALIFFIFIITLVIYVYYTRKMKAKLG